jgi:WD40 repeat protein
MSIKRLISFFGFSVLIVFYSCHNDKEVKQPRDNNTLRNKDSIYVTHFVDSISKLHLPIKYNIVRLKDGRIKAFPFCDVSFLNKEILCKGKLNSLEFKECFTTAVLNNDCTILVTDGKGNAVLYTCDSSTERLTTIDTTFIPLKDIVLNLKKDKVLKITWEEKNQRKEWKLENISASDVSIAISQERIVCQGPPSKELWDCLHQAGIRYKCIIIKNEKDENGNTIITASTCN